MHNVARKKPYTIDACKRFLVALCHAVPLPRTWRCPVAQRTGPISVASSENRIGAVSVMVGSKRSSQGSTTLKDINIISIDEALNVVVLVRAASLSTVDWSLFSTRRLDQHTESVQHQ